MTAQKIEYLITASDGVTVLNKQEAYDNPKAALAGLRVAIKRACRQSLATGLPTLFVYRKDQMRALAKIDGAKFELMVGVNIGACRADTVVRWLGMVTDTTGYLCQPIKQLDRTGAIDLQTWVN